MLSFSCRTIDFIGNYVKFKYFFNCHTKKQSSITRELLLVRRHPLHLTLGSPVLVRNPHKRFLQGVLDEILPKKIYIVMYIFFFSSRLAKDFFLIHCLNLTLTHKVYKRFTWEQKINQNNDKRSSLTTCISSYTLWLITKKRNNNIYGIFLKICSFLFIF